MIRCWLYFLLFRRTQDLAPLPANIILLRHRAHPQPPIPAVLPSLSLSTQRWSQSHTHWEGSQSEPTTICSFSLTPVYLLVMIFFYVNSRYFTSSQFLHDPGITFKRREKSVFGDKVDKKTLVKRRPSREVAEPGAFQLKVGESGGSREEACGALAALRPLITQNNADFVISSQNTCFSDCAENSGSNGIFR